MAEEQGQQGKQEEERPDEQRVEPQKPPEPDPVQKALETAREHARQAREDANRWYQQARQQHYNPPEPDEDEEEDLDPTTKKFVEKKVNTVTQQLAQAYQQEREQDLHYRANLEKKNASKDLPHWSEYEQEIEEYMKNVPLHVKAAEGAYREAYYAIVGRKMTEQAQAQARRAPDVVSSSRSQAEPEPGPRIGEDQQAFLRDNFGVTLSDSELDALSRKKVTIDDFVALQEKK